MSDSNFEASLTAEGRYRLLVEAINDYAIYMLDPKGIVTNWNAGAQRFKGYTAEEIIGQHFSVFYTEQDQAAGRPARNLARAADEGRFEEEGWRVRKDGSPFWAHVVVDRILRPSGQLVGFAKITRDLTERRQSQLELERAREALFQSQKMDAVGQLTGGIAHDFNNLLMAILGSLEIARKRMPPDNNVLPFIDNAIKGARRGATLTQRLLTFARRQELQMGPVGIPELIGDLTEMIERSLGPAVFVSTRFPNSLPPAHTDAAQLETAVLNLVVNARDAMPQGGPIRISADVRFAKGDLPPGEYVVLSVADNGEGMDEETLARAVEPFFTTKGIGKGTGLGLSMVHGLAQQSGGTLRLHSTKGEGTTVEIWLPRADEAGRALREADSPSSEIATPRLKVLAVDDDPLVLMNTVAMLEDLGHEVFEAMSGREALAMLGQTPVDLLITDQGMPQMSGLELVDGARAMLPDLRVIIATGYAELPHLNASTLLRLSKPFSQAELQASVESAVASEPRSAPAA